MPHPKTETDASTAERLLANLSSTIDEAKLVRKIVALHDNLRLIGEIPNQSSRIEFLQNEITELEKKLAAIRNR